MQESLDELEKMFVERKLEVMDAVKEVERLLNGNSDLLERFYIQFLVVYWGCRPEKIKAHQEQLSKMKKLNKKISTKSFELYKLLDEMDDLAGEGLAVDTPDIFQTLELVDEAVKYNHKLNPFKETAAKQVAKYKSILGHTVKRILKKEEPIEYCPCFKYVIYAMHKRSEIYEFRTKIERESSPRALIRAFLLALVGAVKVNHLPDAILKISPDTIADLTNVALDLDSNVTPDNVRKVIDKVLKGNRLDN